MTFAGHSVCQDTLDRFWKGRMKRHTHVILIMLCTLMPFLIPLVISFESPPSNKVTERSQSQNSTQTGDATERKKPTGTKRKMRCPFHLLSIYYFYSAPATKFFSNIVAYMAFLGVFTYFVLIELDESLPGLLEVFTWIWLFTMFVEEVRQMMFRDNVSLKYRFLSWISDLWNQVDAIIILLFIISALLRTLIPIFNGDFKWARAFYSLALALSYIRFMQYFYVVKAMGPKVIMIQKMMADMFLFLAVLLVFVLGFGVAYHANLFPNAVPDWSIVIDVVYYPYFQMYGELFLDHFRGQQDGETCTPNETIWRADPHQRCTEDSRVIVHLLLGAYLIMINIMLVNLLIAMFSYTFQEVQEKSVLIWQYYRLRLVHDYYDRPSLVPPFIILNHIYRAFRYTCGDKRRDRFRRVYSKEKITCQTSFEKLAVKRYYANKRNREQENVAHTP